MLELETISISGMHYDGSLLWIAAPGERLIATWRASTGDMAERLTYAHEVWDLCPDKEGLWIVTGGGRLGRRLVLWSPAQARAIRQFNCPDGAGAGMTLFDGKIWLAHRRNRKLFCLDPESGKVNWVIRTENETFSPTAYKNELWLIESDPGPLGHWSESRQGKYFFRAMTRRVREWSSGSPSPSFRAAWPSTERSSGTLRKAKRAWPQ